MPNKTHRPGVLIKHALLATSAALALAGGAHAETRRFDIPAQDAAKALQLYAMQSGRQVLFPYDSAAGKTAPAIQGEVSDDEALARLAASAGLMIASNNGETVTLRPVAQVPQGGSADEGSVDALIVTAQKREEAIQDVPIAISAFSQKSLEEQKIEGGYDLLKAIPNVTFSKGNFTSYNFSIRGVGTKAISATTDPGVAVAFNNTTLIQNRLFEQEYFDVERVEVLRGPQGTLYGRNATSGVINVITAKPDLNEIEGSLKFEIGNYDTKRVVGMVNIPIIEDVLAVRLAGAMTKRAGYDFNSVTENAVNGRDLWSTRLTVGFNPIDSIRANLVWERFNEDDNRSRTSKQLCHRDPGPTMIGSTALFNPNDPDPIRGAFQATMRPALFSQACQAGSLYDDAAFGTPNGVALPFVYGALFLTTRCTSSCAPFFSLGVDPANLTHRGLLRLGDPYGGLVQSRDLRTIASFRDPHYRASADLVEMSIDIDIGDALTLTSQTAYNEDTVYSFQDYNRFNTLPVFNDTSNLVLANGVGVITGPSKYQSVAPGGVFCDPQLGCSDTLAGFDISQASGKQFSQELRLSSDFDGPINFNFGANFTRFKTLVDYYVFYNILTALAMTGPLNTTGDPAICASGGYNGHVPGPIPTTNPAASCPYIDPNPIDFSENFEGDGHNYFRSKNPYKLKSAAAFGEAYWNITEELKLTAGLRYTKDVKTFIPVPSQVLLAQGLTGGGTTSIGYPEDPPIEQEWGEWTGRLGLDWKPVLPFTDSTMLYGFYSRGYKGGGANPPSPGFALGEDILEQSQGAFDDPVLLLTAVEYGRTFEPEFVDAFEIGAKNTLMDGALTFNTTGFFYDYKDYQISQIRDRTAVNENFDATIWGLEFETVFSPSRDFRVNANLGYLDTEIAEGETSIDIMNRTQDNPNYVLMKPWVQLPSNCVMPLPVVERWLNAVQGSEPLVSGIANYFSLCGGVGAGHVLNIFALPPIDPNPAFGGGTLPYDYRNYPEINGGAGIRAELGGNELPNAPHWTMNIGGQYGRDVLDGSWRMTVRGDAYWQSQSWARVYNAVNDKLHGWYNLNVSVRLANEDLGIEAEFYIKNLLDKSPITDAFINSDDSGLTTNIFVLDPRLVGFNIRKTF